MARLDGKAARAWLASDDADPGLLLRLQAESLLEDAGGEIVDAQRSGIVIQTTKGTRLVRSGELHRWVVQDVPIALVRRIESSIKGGLPVAHLTRLRDEGFDVDGLTQQQALLTHAVIEAADADREADFEGVETVGHMLGAPAQHRAARKLLETVMGSPFVRASGSARIRLAEHASSKGDLARIRALTDAALPSPGASAALTEGARGILLTMRAACLGRFASDCKDIAEARRVAGAAFAILGKTGHLDNTYSLLRGRAEALRCGW